MVIRIKKVHPEAHLPAYAYGPGEDAGLDLRAVETVTLAPGSAQSVATGLAVEIPKGYEGQVRPRSGMCLQHSVTANFGTIDPGYRGEIRMVMFNFGRADYTIAIGDRIAQLVLAHYEPVVWEEGDLGPSERGVRGFGSSGP
jgi:dUTP pyrophosphatase